MTDDELRAALTKLKEHHERFKPYLLEQKKLPPEELQAEYVALVKMLMEEVGTRKPELLDKGGVALSPLDLDHAVLSLLE